MARKLLILVSSLVLTWTGQASAAGGWVYDLTGDVTVVVGKSPASKAVKNSEVTSETVIKTGDNSTVVLKFEDGQVISMQSNSTLKVRRYQYHPENAEKSGALFTALKGGMRFITGLIGKNRKAAFGLNTPSSTIGIRGTEFMTVIKGQSVYNQVVTGGIGLSNKAGTLPLDAGQTAVVSSPTSLASIVSAASLPPGLFSEIASIPVPPATPATAPTPPSTSAPSAPSASTTPSAPSVPALPIPPVHGVIAPAAGVGAAAAGIVGGAAAVGAAAASEDNECEGDDCEVEECEGDDCEVEECEGDDCEVEECEGDDCEVEECEGDDCEDEECEGDDCED